MEVIDHIEVGAGGASSITFMNVGDIPDTFTDLYVVVSARSTAAQFSVYIRPNGSTANLSSRNLQGNGSTLNNFTGTTIQGIATSSGDTANTFSNTSFYIPNYLVNAAKSVSVDAVSENNATQAFQRIAAGLWNDTAPITSLQLLPDNGDFAQYTTATLYGIRKYNTTLAPKASGGIISYDSVNNKWVHVFTASGTFTPTENLSGVEYLVVAGGGAGGGAASGQVAHGGGGAGGYRSSVVGESSGGGASAESTLSLTASTNYTVTIGAGGSGASRTSGSNSVFGSITATGGGAGGASNTANALSGGSGGGAAAARTSGTGTANQGYKGGEFSTLPGFGGGGGGGGANQIGGTGVFGNAGNGGNGISSSITGLSVARGGGGGGGSYQTTPGTGGTGGGGNGGVDLGAAPTAGQANTGGGGGGSGSPSGGGNGGSGIVIVRYGA